MPAQFFFKSVLKTGTYLLTHVTRDNDYCENDFNPAALLSAFTNCNITKADDILQNDTTLIGNEEICPAHWSWGGSNALLYRENNIDIDTVFENCLVHTFQLFFRPWADTWVGGIGPFLIGGFLGSFLSAIIIGVVYEWCFGRSIAQQNYQRLFPAEIQAFENLDIPPANIVAVQLPRIANRMLAPLRQVFVQQNRNILSVSQRLENVGRYGRLHIDVPTIFLCPIGKGLMDDPVTVATGITYDRSKLKEEFARLGNPARIICRSTGHPIQAYEYQNYRSNVEIKTLILGFIENAESKLAIGGRELRSAPLNQPVTYLALTNKANANPASPLTATQRLLELEIKDVVVNIPKTLLCPISQNLMDDPITATSGITFERKALRDYFGDRVSATCPCTTLIIYKSEVIEFESNVIIKKLTEEFLTNQENSILQNDNIATRCSRWLPGWTQNMHRYFYRSEHSILDDEQAREEGVPLLRRYTL